LFGLFKRRRRRRLRQTPFPPAQRAIIERNVPLFLMLPADQQEQLLGHVNVFLHEKGFEGCGGLVITDEIRLTIAAEACLLLLNRETDYYRGLGSILVYPARYVVDTTRHLPGGIVAEGPQVRAGESWLRGVVVLSWDDARHGAVNPGDGYNVVLHEFAHQLDGESGSVEGAPVLPERSMYGPWAEVMSREFARLRDDLAHGRRTVLRPYGATNPAEFFAVATETFFERPEAMRARHPELYAQLQLYYRQDPAAWRRTPADA
jgi:Mlc titration factor MtfA (ptsG expression regulator)